jgi:putative transposase
LDKWKQNLPAKIFWGRGYAALSVSESAIDKVIKYIDGQEEHHRINSFDEEYESFISIYGMKYIANEV